ncbi:hypothetical protein BDI4_830067 [Burkholderia diffusa]|nr:hypothetical protein BDI4_830067 [Burkholderia diffusa]
MIRLHTQTPLDLGVIDREDTERTGPEAVGDVLGKFAAGNGVKTPWYDKGILTQRCEV